MEIEKDKKMVIEGNTLWILRDNNYPIELSDCNTKEKILTKVYHLTQKVWITRKDLKLFIEMVTDHFDMEKY